LDGKISTSQRAVMLCGWGVKAGMTCLQVKLYVAISERFGKCYSIQRRFLQMFGFTLWKFGRILNFMEVSYEHPFIDQIMSQV